MCKVNIKRNKYEWEFRYGDDRFYEFVTDGLEEDAVRHSENEHGEITYKGIQNLAAAIVEDAKEYSDYSDIAPDSLLDSEWNDIQSQLVGLLADYLGVVAG